MNNSENKTITPAAGWFHPKDTVLTIVLLVFCGWLYYLTTRFEVVSDMFAQDITPAFFPQLLLIVITALTLLVPFEHRLVGNGKQLDKDRQSAIGPMTYLTVLLLVSVLLAIPWLGVYLAMVVVCLLLPLLWGERKFLRVALFAAIFPMIVTLVFTQILKVYFEPGIFNLGFR